MRNLIIAALLASVPAATIAAEKKLLWGDTHLHTTYSSDAYTNNNLNANPDVAFRFASLREQSADRGGKGFGIEGLDQKGIGAELTQ